MFRVLLGFIATSATLGAAGSGRPLFNIADYGAKQNASATEAGHGTPTDWRFLT